MSVAISGASGPAYRTAHAGYLLLAEIYILSMIDETPASDAPSLAEAATIAGTASSARSTTMGRFHQGLSASSVSSPHERSDVQEFVKPAYRFAHAGYACCSSTAVVFVHSVPGWP
jgi:hypothetical protein